jgi:hypothetical protein
MDIDIDGDWDYGYGCCWNGAVWGAAAGYWAGYTAGAVYGDVVYTLPASCTVVVVNGITYNQCGDVWYQPQFEGTDTTYIVVEPPQ